MTCSPDGGFVKETKWKGNVRSLWSRSEDEAHWSLGRNCFQAAAGQLFGGSCSAGQTVESVCVVAGLHTRDWHGVQTQSQVLHNEGNKFFFRALNTRNIQISWISRSHISPVLWCFIFITYYISWAPTTRLMINQNQPVKKKNPLRNSSTFNPVFATFC